MTIRKTDSAVEDNLRDKIMRNIEACEDKTLKVVLLTQLEVLDAIGRKIDAVMRDEEVLRDLVLNGDASTHGDDHRQWREFREEWVEIRPMLGILKDRYAHDGYCSWAVSKMDAEKQDAESRRKVRDGWLVHATWATTVVIAGALAAKYLGGV